MLDLKQRARLAWNLISRDLSADFAAREGTRKAMLEAPLSFPAEHFRYLYELVRPSRHSVVWVKGRSEARTDVRFSNFLTSIQAGEHAIPFSICMEVARFADHQLSNFEPFDLYGKTDVAEHFALSSSVGTKGRLLANLVRICRRARILELGTAYGVSAFLMAAMQELCGLRPNVVTVEGFSPMMEISARFLAKKFDGNVVTIHGLKCKLCSIYCFTTVAIKETIMSQSRSRKLLSLENRL